MEKFISAGHKDFGRGFFIDADGDVVDADGDVIEHVNANGSYVAHGSCAGNGGGSAPDAKTAALYMWQSRNRYRRHLPAWMLPAFDNCGNPVGLLHRIAKRHPWFAWAYFFWLMGVNRLKSILARQ